MMKVGDCATVERWENREFKIVKIENDWLLLDLGENQIYFKGWHPDNEDMKRNPYMKRTHYYYWLPKHICSVAIKKHIYIVEV